MGQLLVQPEFRGLLRRVPAVPLRFDGRCQRRFLPARLAGARRIIAVDLLDNKLTYAKQFGATDTINAKSENVGKRVKEGVAGMPLRLCG